MQGQGCSYLLLVHIHARSLVYTRIYAPVCVEYVTCVCICDHTHTHTHMCSRNDGSPTSGRSSSGERSFAFPLLRCFDLRPARPSGASFHPSLKNFLVTHRPYVHTERARNKHTSGERPDARILDGVMMFSPFNRIHGCRRHVVRGNGQTENYAKENALI